MRMVARIVGAIWILINLYAWLVVSLPPSLTQELPPGLSSYYAHHRALLTRVFYRPYVWSPEGK